MILGSRDDDDLESVQIPLGGGLWRALGANGSLAAASRRQVEHSR